MGCVEKRKRDCAHQCPDRRQKFRRGLPATRAQSAAVVPGVGREKGRVGPSSVFFGANGVGIGIGAGSGESRIGGLISGGGKGAGISGSEIVSRPARNRFYGGAQ